MKKKDNDISIEIGSPVREFVKNFLQEASDGLNDSGYVSCSQKEAHTVIELNATEIKEINGGLKIHIFNANVKSQNNNIQKMTIYAKKQNQIDIEEEKTKIAIAKNKRDELENEEFNSGFV